jgi:cytochrome c peroxidase
MHNGVFKTLQEVVDFYDQGGGKGSNKTALLKPLNLSVQDKKDLLAFLDALSMTEPLIHEDPKLPGDYQPLPAPVK